MAGSLGQRDVEILQVNVGASGATQIMFGDLYGPLQVATGGTSLLFNQAGFNETSDGFPPTVAWSYLLRQSLVPGVVGHSSGFHSLKPGLRDRSRASDRPTAPAWRLVARTPAHLGTLRLSTRTRRRSPVNDLGPGTPLAWEPGGKALLVSDSPLSSISLEGETTRLPYAGPSAAITPYQFYTETPSTTRAHSCSPPTGPQALVQNQDGAYVYNISSQQTSQLVEPTRVAPPTASVNVVVATDQVFAWALQCFGIGERSCNAELRRLSLATGIRDVVASGDRALPFAVSPDGTKIAFADDQNIYVKSIQP